MFTFGNGGSSTDAATLAALFAQPTAAKPLPAWSLTSDRAVLTALGNDVGFDLVFVRQLIARAQSSDIAIAMSTSGNSADLLLAMREAHHRGLYTIGFTGYDGGAFVDNPDVDVCFVVRSQSVHRIQEAHAMLGYQLCVTVQAEMSRREQLR
jgi:D-sedoheptulose 7-phosphate isomerase